MITQPGPANWRTSRPCGRGRSGAVRWLVRSMVLIVSSLSSPELRSTLEIKGSYGRPPVGVITATPTGVAANRRSAGYWPAAADGRGERLGGQRLLLELLELLLGNGAAVKQALRRRDLVCRTAALTSNRLNVLVGGHLGLSHLSRLSIGHTPTASDQVDNCREGREDDQEDDPERLPPPAQILVSEEITDDLEEHHQIHHEEKGPNEEPEEVPETVHLRQPSA